MGWALWIMAGAAAAVYGIGSWLRRSSLFQEPDFDVTCPAGVCLLEETHDGRISGASRACRVRAAQVVRP